MATGHAHDGDREGNEQKDSEEDRPVSCLDCGHEQPTNPRPSKNDLDDHRSRNDVSQARPNHRYHGQQSGTERMSLKDASR